jgi:OOP family OmpA-OmpF porin
MSTTARRRTTPSPAAPLVFALLALPAAAHAAAPGFQLNRYEPTGAGEANFIVDRPWYSESRRFALGVTLDYAHNPLVLGVDQNAAFTVNLKAVEHALLGHVDAAISVLDRATVAFSMPLTLKEAGSAPAADQPDPGISPSSFAVGDPRIGLMIRLWNHMDDNAFSIHVGASLWIPTGADASNVHAGDASARVQPRVVVGGVFADHVRWAVSGGYLHRQAATLGDPKVLLPSGISVGSEVTLAASLAYTDSARRWNVGPEAIVQTIVLDGNGGHHAFDKDYTSIEALVGAQYLIADAFALGLAVGTGTLREPGTPDVRALLRFSFAPQRPRK